MPPKKGMREMLGLRSKRSTQVSSDNTAAPGPGREPSAYEATAAVVATAPSLPRSVAVPMGGYVTQSRPPANGYPLTTTNSNSTTPISPVTDGIGSSAPSIIGVPGTVSRVDSPVSELSHSNSISRPNARQSTELSAAAHHAQASRRAPSLRTTVPAAVCQILTPVEEEARKIAESPEPVKQKLNRPKTWAETSEEFKQQLQQMQQQKEQERRISLIQAVQENQKEDDQLRQRLAKEIESSSSSPVSCTTATVSPISPDSTLSQSPAVERANKVREELAKLHPKQAEDERLSELEGFPELPVAIELPSMTSYAPDRHGQIAELHSHHIPAVSSGKGNMHPSLIPGPHNHRRTTSEIQDIPAIVLSTERPVLPDRSQSEPANLRYGTRLQAAATLGLPTVTIIPPTPSGTPSPTENKEQNLPDPKPIEAEIPPVEEPVVEKVSEPQETGSRYVIPPPPPPPVLPASPLPFLLESLLLESLDSHQQSPKHYELATIQDLSVPAPPRSTTMSPSPEVLTLKESDSLGQSIESALDAVGNDFGDLATENGDDNGLPSPPLTPEDTPIIPQGILEAGEISPVDMPDPSPFMSASFIPGTTPVHPVVGEVSNEPEAPVQVSASYVPSGLPILPVKETQVTEEVSAPVIEVTLPLNAQQSPGGQPSGFSMEKVFLSISVARNSAFLMPKQPDEALFRPATMPPSASAPMASPPMARSATMPSEGAAPDVPPEPQTYQPYRPPFQRPPSPTTLAGVINSLPPSGAVMASTNNAPASRPQSRQPSPYRSVTCPIDSIPIRRPSTPEQDKQPLLVCMGDHYPEPRPMTPEKDKQPLLACLGDSWSDAHSPARRQNIRKPSPPRKDGNHAALMNLVGGYQPYPGRPNVGGYAVAQSTPSTSRGRYSTPRSTPFTPHFLTTEIAELQQNPTPRDSVSDQGKSEETEAGLANFCHPPCERSDTPPTVSSRSSTGSLITGVGEETVESPADTEHMSIHSLNIARTAAFSGSPRVIQIPHRQALMQPHHQHHQQQLHHQFSQPQLGQPLNQQPSRGHGRSQSQDPSTLMQGHNKTRSQEFIHQTPRVWNVMAEQEWVPPNPFASSGSRQGSAASIRAYPGRGFRELGGQGQVAMGGSLERGRQEKVFQALEMMNSAEIGLGRFGGYPQAAGNEKAHAIQRKPVPGRN